MPLWLRRNARLFSSSPFVGARPSAVRKAVKSGRGEAWLVYRLTPEDALVAESLSDPEFRAYRARRVSIVEFTFGR